jgi:hypothetical protein
MKTWAGFIKNADYNAPFRHMRFSWLFAAVTSVCLGTSIRTSNRARPFLYRIAKSGLGRRGVRGSTVQLP